MVICQLKARTALLEDGMNEEEALLAVEPPVGNNTNQFNAVDGEHKNKKRFSEDRNNPYELKRCSIRLRKLWYIEKAVDFGCTTIWMPPKSSNGNKIGSKCTPKPVW